VIKHASPIRIVLDTNVLLRAMMNRAIRSRDVVMACEVRKAICILSKPLLDEYRRVLAHLQERDESITQFAIQAQLRKLQYLGEYVRQVRASFLFPRDPTDAKLIELAIEADATHIVTYDADLLSLPTSRKEAGKRFRQRLRGVSVTRPEELLRPHPELLPPV
jgi:putative PIN family toxin of toxin-antitoxin system